MKRIQKGLPVKRQTFLFTIKRLLSYFWPVTIDRCGDDPKVKLVLEFGKLVVNKGAANYSYGQLQAAFAEFFDRADIQWDDIHDVLILGYGMGSVADLVEVKCTDVHFTGVEVQPCLLQWEKEYFNDHTRTLICEDAFKFIEGNTRRYNMIIVDIFEELDVPEPFRQIEFLQHCSDQLHPDGSLIYNFVIDREEHRTQYSDLQVHLSDLFRQVTFSEHFGVNRIILAK